MTNTHNPQQQRQKLEHYQEQLLQQYSDLFEESVYQTAEQALNDRLANAETIAIRKAFGRFKEHSQGLLQGRLQELNQTNSQKILQLRSQMPTVDELDDTPDLELPSLQAGISQQMNHFGVLTSNDDENSLPSDLSEALQA
ncbi:MAG: hypothetical protein GVY17_10920 [Cyanobacteria bacterium]|jgi:hypothetical protein|nr:hypothetical protein [Cyanobacteria bacterium GSL.Bin21]